MDCSFYIITTTNTSKVLQLLMLFSKFYESNHKPNKIWEDNGSQFYNRSLKSWLQDNDIEIYSTHNEEKSVVAEKFTTALKNKIYKYMTSVSKYVYIDKLDDIVNKQNNTHHSTIKMKPVNVKSSTYIYLKKIIRKILNLKLVIV